MKRFFRYFLWTLKAALFFTLFAFALNNQQETTLHFFFGRQWQAPLVLVVLSTFSVGVVVGVLGMVPRWWRHRRLALKHAGNARDQVQSQDPSSQATDTVVAPSADIPHAV